MGTDFRSAEHHCGHLLWQRLVDNGLDDLRRLWGVLAGFDHHPVACCKRTHQGTQRQNDREVPWRNDQDMSFGLGMNVGSGSQHGQRRVGWLGGHPSTHVPSRVFDFRFQRKDLLKVHLLTGLAQIVVERLDQFRFMRKHRRPKVTEPRPTLGGTGGAALGSGGLSLTVKREIQVFHGERARGAQRKVNPAQIVQQGRPIHASNSART